jgi:hypothetical protein
MDISSTDSSIARKNGPRQDMRFFCFYLVDIFLLKLFSKIFSGRVPWLLPQPFLQECDGSPLGLQLLPSGTLNFMFININIITNRSWRVRYCVFCQAYIWDQGRYWGFIHFNKFDKYSIIQVWYGRLLISKIVKQQFYSGGLHCSPFKSSLTLRANNWNFASSETRRALRTLRPLRTHLVRKEPICS